MTRWSTAPLSLDRHGEILERDQPTDAEPDRRAAGPGAAADRRVAQCGDRRRLARRDRRLGHLRRARPPARRHVDHHRVCPDRPDRRNDGPTTGLEEQVGGAARLDGGPRLRRGRARRRRLLAGHHQPAPRGYACPGVPDPRAARLLREGPGRGPRLLRQRGPRRAGRAAAHPRGRRPARRPRAQAGPRGGTLGARRAVRDHDRPAHDSRLPAGAGADQPLGVPLNVVELGYGAAFGVVKRLPRAVAWPGFAAVADRSARRYRRGKSGPGTARLAANLRRVVGDAMPADEFAELIRRALRSYARYYLDAFQLPARTREEHRTGFYLEHGM